MLKDELLKLVEIEFLRRKKDVSTAYILCIFFWFLGIHKFYLNKIGEGILYILLPPLSLFFTISGFFSLNSTFFHFGIFVAGVTILYIIYDLLTLWKQVENSNYNIYRSIFEKICGVPYENIIQKGVDENV